MIIDQGLYAEDDGYQWRCVKQNLWASRGRLNLFFSKLIGNLKQIGKPVGISKKIPFPYRPPLRSLGLWDLGSIRLYHVIFMQYF